MRFKVVINYQEKRVWSLENRKIIAMIYPEGETVRVGDIIWTNEGINVQRVVRIMESPLDFQKEGLEEPGIYWTSDLSEFSSDVIGFEAEADFEYEGIGRLSSDELLLIKCLHKICCQSCANNLEKCSYTCVRYPIKIGGKVFEQRWFLLFYTGKDITYFMFKRDSLEFIKLSEEEYDKIRGQIKD